MNSSTCVPTGSIFCRPTEMATAFRSPDLFLQVSFWWFERVSSAGNRLSREVRTMCRLYGFHANEETKVECTLVHAQNALLRQSASDALGRAHPDGWGIAWYENRHPVVVRRKIAAFRDRHFSHTAERIFTRTVVAHVRLATVGVPSEANAHPFHYGCWSFAHNGTVRQFGRLRRRLVRQMLPALQDLQGGTTDSQHVFHWLLSALSREGVDLEQPSDADAAVTRILATGITTLAQWCAAAGASAPARLNFVLTNGRFLLASRFNNSLYAVERPGLRDCEICGIPHVHHDTGFAYHAAVVASERLSHEDWQPVPNGSIAVINPAGRLTVQNIRNITEGPLVGLEEEEAASCP